MPRYTFGTLGLAAGRWNCAYRIAFSHMRRQQGASAPLARPPRVPYGTLYAPTLRSSGLTASDRLTQGVSHTHTLPDQTHTLHVENIAGPGACFPVWMGEHAADDRLCSFHDRVRHPSLPVERGGGGSVASLHRRDARAATITRVLFVSWGAYQPPWPPPPPGNPP